MDNYNSIIKIHTYGLELILDIHNWIMDTYSSIINIPY